MRIGTYYRFNFLKEHLPTIDINSILDVGGYDGYITHRIAARRKVLVDPQAKPTYKDINYKKENFFNFNTDEKFDLILALDVIEHIPPLDKKPFLDKIKSLLSKRGVAIFTFPDKKMKVFPAFVSNYVHKRWGHKYIDGMDYMLMKELWKGEDVLMMAFNLRWFCTLYFLMWITKCRWLLRFAAKKDQDIYGKANYYLVRMHRNGC
jgi:hypothetical protein